jgi:GTPase SAR1 family protein
MLGPESINFMTKDMRALVKQIQDLRHLGIEDSKIALPKICVVGDQSTGKSSLIEGMSEIQVPRSAGTCTRCPMEINLSDSDEPWKCSISLTNSHIFSTKQGFRKVTKAKPLGPWNPLSEPQDEPFMTIFSKDQVQDAIKRAQLAILNPTTNPAEYLPGSSINIENATTVVKFSPNVVRLDITAPNFPNLSFYDLPGVISQTEVDDETYLVTIVENLVKHYVSQENCIILLTLPMTDDATNSSAARIVREIKATHRTLGVLTKPDRVEDVSQWTDLLTGQKFRFGHGYYVVRNNPDPKVEHQRARAEEEHFFAGSPWTEDRLAVFKSRLGTRNLQNALSKLLLDQIKECLPRITTQIHEKAQWIDEQLSFLPEPVNQNTLYVLCSKLQELKTAISASLEGGSKEMSMLKIWNHIAEDFFTAIQHTKPMVHLLTAHEIYMKVPKETVDSDVEVTGVASAKPTPKRKLGSDSEREPGENPLAMSQALANPLQKYRTEHFRQFYGMLIYYYVQQENY